MTSQPEDIKTETTEQRPENGAGIIDAIDRLTYAVLGLVSAVNEHPGVVTVFEAPAPAMSGPAPLSGPFFHQGGRRYARTADGVVPVDAQGLPVPNGDVAADVDQG